MLLFESIFVYGWLCKSVELNVIIMWKKWYSFITKPKDLLKLSVLVGKFKNTSYSDYLNTKNVLTQNDYN